MGNFDKGVGCKTCNNKANVDKYKGIVGNKTDKTPVKPDKNTAKCKIKITLSIIACAFSKYLGVLFLLFL